MTQLPTHIRPADTVAQSWDDPRRGRATFRLLVTAGGGPSEALVQGIMDIPAGEREAMHHHDRPETAYVLSGGGILTLKGKEIVIQSGDMMFIPEGLVHGWRAGEEGLQLLWSFPGDRFEDVAYHWEGD